MSCHICSPLGISLALITICCSPAFAADFVRTGSDASADTYVWHTQAGTVTDSDQGPLNAEAYSEIQTQNEPGPAITYADGDTTITAPGLFFSGVGTVGRTFSDSFYASGIGNPPNWTPGTTQSVTLQGTANHRATSSGTIHGSVSYSLDTQHQLAAGWFYGSARIGTAEFTFDWPGGNTLVVKEYQDGALVHTWTVTSSYGVFTFSQNVTLQVDEDDDIVIDVMSIGIDFNNFLNLEKTVDISAVIM